MADDTAPLDLDAIRPDCYTLVTNSLYGHTVAPCAKCPTRGGS